MGLLLFSCLWWKNTKSVIWTNCIIKNNSNKIQLMILQKPEPPDSGTVFFTRLFYVSLQHNICMDVYAPLCLYLWHCNLCSDSVFCCALCSNYLCPDPFSSATTFKAAQISAMEIIIIPTHSSVFFYPCFIKYFNRFTHEELFSKTR